MKRDIFVDPHLGFLFHAVFLLGVTIPGELATFLEEWGLVSGGAEHAGTCDHRHHHLAMVVVEDGDWLMAGIGEDLQEEINREQMKVGKGSSFLGGKKRGFLGGLQREKERGWSTGEDFRRFSVLKGGKGSFYIFLVYGQLI